MFGSTVRGAALAVVVLAGFAVSCDADPATPSAASSASSAPSAPSAGSTPSASSLPGPSEAGPAAPSAARGASSSALPGTPPEKVRDAFAGLQATLDGSCTPSECSYFLGRVHDELHGLDAAMKADPKGPGHFPEPIALIAKLDAELGGDRSFKNLKEHQTLLIGTRDKINTWMQGHPDDYR
ncbi:hypothetical protein MRQ86_06235 [Streptomyces sp. MMS21 TC-5]|uniref:hypothetical protein n=1 Tax=Streptomyces sp. MMS21 TC-5 TaxID=2925833 RepID=UPI001F61C159|nr:hypothetical protein [Streptomyces sp. MMS21 TC-5]MCI4079945.1 hypothetical protein [Streptomyces sp. MMS21 TC-5]